MPQNLWPLFLLAFGFFLSSCGTQGTVPESQKISGDFYGCATGAHVAGIANLPGFQTTAGKNLAVVLLYIHWQDAFPSSDATIIDNNGSIPLITWEPWLADSSTLESIGSGKYDTYIRSFIQSSKAWGKPFFLRFGHEMNGNWYPWSGTNNGHSAAGPQNYKNAWVHIYNLREELQADNINLVWSPNSNSVPADAWNALAAYYPGDQYVDWVGVDGYNHGDTLWKSFDAIFSNAYVALTALTQKPLMLAEFASAEQGGDKASWITDAFTKIKNNYPKLKIFCWFNENKEALGERDWRINSSSSAEAAFKTALQDSYYSSKIN